MHRQHSTAITSEYQDGTHTSAFLKLPSSGNVNNHYNLANVFSVLPFLHQVTPTQSSNLPSKSLPQGTLFLNPSATEESLVVHLLVLLIMSMSPTRR